MKTLTKQLHTDEVPENGEAFSGTSRTSGSAYDWISVHDRLPDDERQVLTSTHDNIYGADTYCPKYGWVNACGDDMPGEVLFWCEIIPPNVTDQGRVALERTTNER